MLALSLPLLAGCESATVRNAKQALATELRDPASAKFGDIFDGSDRRTCGYVNAKNAFGGYTGDRKFITIGTAYAQIEPAAGDALSETFQADWRSYCAGASGARR